MPRTIEWEIPSELQPKAEDCGYDLDQTLNGVLGLQAIIPEDAFTAPTLGTERAGSGVLIRKEGLVLTIGYLITESETIWLTSTIGGAVPGTMVVWARSGEGWLTSRATMARISSRYMAVPRSLGSAEPAGARFGHRRPAE